MKALLIEDEKVLQALVAQELEAAGFEVIAASDGPTGLQAAQTAGIRLGIVDLGLPGIDGIEVVRGLRKLGYLYPILILTARDGWQSKVMGLEAGADDYLIKPFHREELMARVAALMRRSEVGPGNSIVSGPYRLDTVGHTITRDGESITLTAFEYRVLEYFFTHPGKTVSKKAFTDMLYGDGTERDSNVVEVFVRRIRLKLDPQSKYSPITTLRNAGYVWALPVSPP